jgi:hypothetical protein
MSATIALKCRLEHGKKRNAGSNRASVLPFRAVSIGSEAEIPARFLKHVSSENEAANLLLSMSDIVSDEMKSNACLFDDETDTSIVHSSIAINEILLTPQHTTYSNTSDDLFVWNRVRTVSMDSSSVPTGARDLAVVSPTTTPVSRGRQCLRKTSRRLSKKAKRDFLKFPKIPQLSQNSDIKGQKKKALQGSVTKGKTIKKILRKKFSWKNYPGTKFSLPQSHHINAILFL